MSVPKRLKYLQEPTETLGWTWDETRDGHPRVSPPKGWHQPGTDRLAAPVTFGKTPSDSRGDKNAEALLRRFGVDVPRKTTKKKGTP